MVLALEQVAETVAKLHKAAETAVVRDNRFTGMIVLILPDTSIGAVLPFGPNGTPPSDEFIITHAAARRAVGLALTGQYWIGLAPITRQQAALGPHDLPRPSETPTGRRNEQIITTAIVRAQNQALRYRTPIHRTAFGVGVGERTETHDTPAMPTGEAHRLIALLERA